MPFIETTEPDRAAGAVADMYARQQAAWGYVPNYAKVFCHRPEAMARWGQLLAEIKRPMERRTFELVTFVAAHELRNTACTLAHGKVLREFFSDEHIVAIAAGKFDGVLNDAEAALVRFARQIAKDASRITSGQVQVPVSGSAGAATQDGLIKTKCPALTISSRPPIKSMLLRTAASTAS